VVHVERRRGSKTSGDDKEPLKSTDDFRRALLMDREEVVLDEIRQTLLRVTNGRSIEAYAVALELIRAPCKPLTKGVTKGVEGIVRSIARDSLRDPMLGTWASDMPVKHDDYVRFISYHRRCRIRLIEFLATGELIKATGNEWVWYNTKCGVCPIVPQSSVVSSATLGIEKYPAAWWVTHWEMVVAAAGETPCEGPFEDKNIWGGTLRALRKECPTCHKAAETEFPIFREQLVSLVTKIINGVRIHSLRRVDPSVKTLTHHPTTGRIRDPAVTLVVCLRSCCAVLRLFIVPYLVLPSRRFSGPTTSALLYITIPSLCFCIPCSRYLP